jgi:hypothetical protein
MHRFRRRSAARSFRARLRDAGAHQCAHRRDHQELGGIMTTRTFAVATAAAAALMTVGPVTMRAQGFGVKGGLSYGNVSSNGALPGNIKSHSGFAVGVGLLTGRTIGLGVEALYADRGVNISTLGDRKLTYLDVPAYLRVGLPTPGVSPFAYAGPQMSFELKCDAGGTACPDNGRSKTTFAGVIGGGLRFGALGGLSIEGRYIYGLSDLNLGTVTTSANYKTRSFMILMGIGF